MKRALSVLLCLILVIGCFPLTALADDTKIDDGGETGINLTTTVPGLSSITVTPPTKTEYLTGDLLDTAGMVVTAKYTDNSARDVTKAATLSDFDSSAAGQVTVTVSYTEKEITKTDTFTVTVLESAPTRFTIRVSSDPEEVGSVFGGGEYNANDSVTVMALTHYGSFYSFVAWMENGEQVSTDEIYTFYATKDRDLVAVFERIPYTVTVMPGNGIGQEFTVDNSEILTDIDIEDGNYDPTKGCFFSYMGSWLDDYLYSFPSECPFEAPEGMEFDCWKYGDNQTGLPGFELQLYKFPNNSTNLTITAQWKPKENYDVTLSIPTSIDVKYGDLSTPVNIEVKELNFPLNKKEFRLTLFDSYFTNSENSSTIRFNVSGGNQGYQQAKWTYSSDDTAPFPRKIESGIDITEVAWETAKPGSYTATLKIAVQFV